MRIAITMRSFETASNPVADGDRGDPQTDCFAEFHVEEADAMPEAGANAESSDWANTRNWLASGVKLASCVARCSARRTAHGIE